MVGAFPKKGCWLIPAMPHAVAFALAAIVSPTDPVAVSAITARVPMPKRVMHTLEGESLLNDASGLVCFRFAVAAALTGMFSLSSAAFTFVQLAAVGVALGVGLTYGIVWAKTRISRRFGEESGSQVVITLLLPFVAYQVAEHFGGSGILAAVAAGGAALCLVRGAITLAGVLTLPLVLADGTPFPARDLAIFLAAGVIILSPTAANLALPRLLVGLAAPGEHDEEAELDEARHAAAEAAIRAVEEALHEMARGHSDANFYAEAAARVMDRYRRRVEGHATGENAARVRQIDRIERRLRLAGLRAERDTIYALARAQKISDAASRKLVREVDLVEERFRWARERAQRPPRAIDRLRNPAEQSSGRTRTT